MEEAKEDVSTMELVGMVSTAALLGASVGAAVCASLALGRHRHDASRARRRDAYAEWLAARKTLTRASVSFITSFRALAAEPSQSSHFPLRREEAQRARSAWCDAMRELDRAEAMLVAWGGDHEMAGWLARFDRPSPDLLRSAIEGDVTCLHAELERLRDADARVERFVRGQVGEGRRQGTPGLIGRASRGLADIMDSWTRA